MKRILFYIISILVLIGLGVGIDRVLLYLTENEPLRSPFVFQDKPKDLPLEQYELQNLRDKSYLASQIRIEDEISSTLDFTSYQFSYTTLGKKMTGQLNVPTTIRENTPVIVMIRGYVPAEIYSTGVGTRNAAAVFATNGYITIAPDFFGYGDSDPEPEDSWQARFEKPIIIIELLESIKKYGVPISETETNKSDTIGFWAHSNGGQIALSVLEITKMPIPTTLWAPVTAPFPYSIMFFSDESDDEGKGMRLWVNQLEQDYDLKNFSITAFLDGLSGPILIHHGTADEAALKAWSDEFLIKIEKENDRRSAVLKEYKKSATEAAKLDDPLLQPIDITYYQYPGADHNMVPSWDLVVSRDLDFYARELAL